jgi:hypothetical protein
MVLLLYCLSSGLNHQLLFFFPIFPYFSDFRVFPVLLVFGVLGVLEGLGAFEVFGVFGVSQIFPTFPISDPYFLVSVFFGLCIFRHPNFRSVFFFKILHQALRG